VYEFIITQNGAGEKPILQSAAEFDIRLRVEEYISLGLDPVPLEPRSKAIKVPGWPDKTFTMDDFLPGSNVGLRWGRGNAVDVDCDCFEAVALAGRFLPETGFVFGRPSARASHFVYRLTEPARTVQLHCPVTKKSIIELRANGQTMAPGSTHPSGELVDFESGATRMIQNVDTAELLQAVNRIGAAALLARHWPSHGRHNAMLALAGILARAGWKQADARSFCEGLYQAVPTHDRAAVGRVRGEVESSFKRLAEGGALTGIPTLRDVLDPKVITAALKWLSIDGAATSAGEGVPGPDAGGAEHGEDEFGLHDVGNANRLVLAYGEDIVYCEERASFYVWTGVRWKLDRHILVDRMAEKVMFKMGKDAWDIADGSKRDKVLSWVRSTLKKSGIESMVSVSHRKLRLVGADHFDKGAYLLNFQNGTLELETGTLREHRRDDLISKCIPYDYDATATCPTFHRFLNRIMGYIDGGDRETNLSAANLTAHLRILLGSGLTGKAEKIIGMFHGATGNNGKSTLLGVIRAALGADEYAGTLQIESLMESPGAYGLSNTINSDLSGLQGCRFVTASEPKKGARFDVARLKHIVGLATIKARRLRENPFTFEPSHKLFIDCNDRPIISDPKDAVWNRIKMIPFNVTIPESEIDAALPEKLRAELPGIMSWLVIGAEEFIQHGLPANPEAEAAKQGYQEASDRLTGFYAEECMLGPKLWVSRTDLWMAYVRWEADNGTKYPMLKPAFEERIERSGCRKTKKVDGSIRAWEGIGLQA